MLTLFYLNTSLYNILMSACANKGLSGLTNLGNTCFMNSCLQILSHSSELNVFFNLNTYKQHLKNNAEALLLVEWNELRKSLWEKNATITPTKFLTTVQQVAHIKKQILFTGYNQNDVSEFFIFLINCFHDAISREVTMSIKGSPLNKTDIVAKKCFETIKTMYSKDYSEIWDLFYGIQISHIKSIKTNKLLSITPEPFLTLSLPIPLQLKSPSLGDCFNLYTSTETLDDDNKLTNEKTGLKETVNKQLLFWSFPQLLVIDLKRFNSSNKKNQILVSFPLVNLDLTKHVCGYNKQSFKYDLYGVCNHMGSSLGGHYTSFVKASDDKWYHFNDTLVTEICLHDNIITPNAYCLFYRKQNNL